MRHQNADDIFDLSIWIILQISPSQSETGVDAFRMCSSRTLHISFALRDTIHKIEGQLKEEGLSVPFSRILSEAVFCGNALLTTRDSSSCDGVYGRVRRTPPGIDQVPEGGASREPLPGLIRDAHRFREISVQAMIEGSAIARLGRAMNARTTMAAQHLDLRVGEEVDFYQRAVVLGMRGNGESCGVPSSATARHRKLFSSIKEAAHDMSLKIDGAIVSVGTKKMPSVSARYGIGTLLTWRIGDFNSIVFSEKRSDWSMR